ncbi:GH17111 [Drosophila grimshawi]|uniref:gamma-glutamylcyclotransferase n=1 Tax=Drosophila grimshawi TaxID=7222 RepID=B4J0L8_DROGR|nr:GH17111 [Drosophila grimshawi]
MKVFITLIYIVALSAINGAGADLNINQTYPLAEVHGDKFYYFGFGSNMLAKRIHIQNPSAEIVGPALLEDYRLDFAMVSSVRWDGAVATIVPTRGTLTWGTLWQIDLSKLADIDNQEGVHLGIYRPISVQVKLHGRGTEISTRAYHLVHQPESNLHEMEPDQVPENRQPSKTYLQVLVKGAIESGIPENYVKWLQGLKHNNKTVSKLEETLQVREVELFN